MEMIVSHLGASMPEAPLTPGGAAAFQKMLDERKRLGFTGETLVIEPLAVLMCEVLSIYPDDFTNEQLLCCSLIDQTIEEFDLDTVIRAIGLAPDTVFTREQSLCFAIIAEAVALYDLETVIRAVTLAAAANGVDLSKEIA